MEKPLTRPPPSGTLSPGRGLSFLARVEVRRAALSRGERVDRDGAFTSRSGPGEGLIRRDSRLRLKHSQPHCSVRPQVSSKRLQSNRSELNSATQFANPGLSSSLLACPEFTIYYSPFTIHNFDGGSHT